MRKKLLSLILFTFLNKSLAMPFCCGSNRIEADDAIGRIVTVVESYATYNSMSATDIQTLKGRIYELGAACLNPQTRTQKSQTALAKLIFLGVIEPVVTANKQEIKKCTAEMEDLETSKSRQAELRKESNLTNAQRIRRAKDIEIFCKNCGIPLIELVMKSVDLKKHRAFWEKWGTDLHTRIVAVEYHYFNPRIRNSITKSNEEASERLEELESGDEARVNTLSADYQELKAAELQPEAPDINSPRDKAVDKVSAV